MILQSQTTATAPLAADAPPIAPARASIAQANTKLMLVSFRNGEAVARHPELMPYLRDGWEISSAVPRIVEHGGTRLFVVLRKPASVL